MIEQAQRTAMPAEDDRNEPIAAIRTVRDAVFDVMRRLGMTTIFGNPGSTEIRSSPGCRPTSTSCWACTRARWSGWPPVTRWPAASRRSSTCTPPPGWATRSTPSPTPVTCARRWWSWSASRTGASSPTSRFSPGGRWRGWPASTRCGRTCRRTGPGRPGAIARAYNEAGGAGPGARRRAHGRLARARRRLRPPAGPNARCARVAVAAELGELAEMIEPRRRPRSWSAGTRRLRVLGGR